MATIIHVDVVEPGKALITGGDHSGRVARDVSTYRVEDTDSEQYIGNVQNYRMAGKRFAEFHGITDYTVEVEREF